MKKTIKFIPTIILAIIISYSSAAACGEQTNGNRCLVENQPPVTKSENPDNPRIDLIEIMRTVFGKFFT